MGPLLANLGDTARALDPRLVPDCCTPPAAAPCSGCSGASGSKRALRPRRPLTPDPKEEGRRSGWRASFPP